MEKECIWYNGTSGNYEVLDFDPDNLSKKKIVAKARKILKKKYTFSDEDLNEALKTLYLLNIENLEKLNIF